MHKVAPRERIRRKPIMGNKDILDEVMERKLAEYLKLDQSDQVSKKYNLGNLKKQRSGSEHKWVMSTRYQN